MGHGGNMEHKQTIAYHPNISPKRKKINMYEFSGKEMETLYIPDSVEVIEESAFEYCGYLKYIIFNKNTSRLKVIKRNAFRGCYNVKGIQLPNHHVKIQENALNFMEDTDEEYWNYSKTIKYSINKQEEERNKFIMNFCFPSNITPTDAKRPNRPHWYR